MRRRVALAPLLLAMACAGCIPAGRVAPSPAVTPATAPGSVRTPAQSARTSPRPSAAAATTKAVSRGSFVVGGSRPVTVQVPASAERGGSAPLLILLHGSGSSGRGLEGYLHLGAAASAGGFLVAEPDGTPDRDGKRFWDATDACCDFDRTGVDDSTYLRDVIAAVRSAAAVDPKRIFVLGFSNGGFMSYRLACDHADLIAAIVSISGATFGTSSACRPSEPVAVLEIHGTADGSVAYGGGRIAGVGSPGHPPASYPGARATATDWATYDGCVTDATELPGRVDVDRRITAPSGGTAEATREVWQACRPGGAVELWTIPGGGHAPAVSTGFAGETLGFLEAHPKP